MLYAIFGVLVIILDQWVKYWAAGNLVYGGEAKPLIPGIINLLNVHNDGAAFSFLSGANAGKIFVILALVFTVLVIIGLATNFISGRLARWCAVFVAAGGIGNAIDRALYSYVQDMFQFAFAPSFPVFNVADIFIVVFCFLFIICIIFGGRREKRRDQYEEEYDLEEEEEELLKPRRSRAAAENAVPAEDAEEDLPPRRSASKRVSEPEEFDYEEESPRRSRQQAAPAEPEEDEDSPRFRNKMNTSSHAKTTRKERQNKYDDQFEQYKANRDARQRSAEYSGVSSSAPAFASSVPAYDSSDPFAEWEKANASISAQKAARASAPAERRAPASPAAGEQRRPRPSATAVQEAAPEAPKKAPAPEKRPAEAVPSAPASSGKSGEEFSLDDILAEFR